MRLGNDASEFSTNNAIVKTDIVDGGLFKLDALKTGRYLTLRRDLLSPVWGGSEYKIMEIRAY